MVFLKVDSRTDAQRNHPASADVIEQSHPVDHGEQESVRKQLTCRARKLLQVRRERCAQEQAFFPPIAAEAPPTQYSRKGMISMD
jgi:hypothetical protein